MSQAIAFADESIWPCKKLLWSGLLKIHTASILRNLIRKRYSAIEGFGFVECLAQSIGRRWREWQMKAREKAYSEPPNRRCGEFSRIQLVMAGADRRALAVLLPVKSLRLARQCSSASTLGALQKLVIAGALPERRLGRSRPEVRQGSCAMLPKGPLATR